MKNLGKFARFIDSLAHKMNFSIELLKPKPVWQGGIHRFDYQKMFYEFNIQPGSIVLDVGSGGDPFPYATVITDRFIEPSRHRTDTLATAGKPFFVSAIEYLP